MRAKQQLEEKLKQILKELNMTWPEKAVLEPPKDKKFGDLAANLALVLAKEAGKNPRDLAAALADKLRCDDSLIADVSVAGPGFLNVRFSPDFWREEIRLVEEKGADYGRNDSGNRKRVQVEYVSANPTGPLHIGHGRGAAIGDSLARILRFSGYDVETEYYINDAGRQMRLLGLSVWLRARELKNLPVSWPEDWYKGAYIVEIAKELLAARPGLLDLPEEQSQDICFEYAMQTIFDGIKRDLKDFRVSHERWFSERSLVDSGAVARGFEMLKKSGYSYEKDGALWFRTTALGDDLDRVLKKSDGSLTYFASDIAYHNNKFERGFELVVDIWGADHHGYIPRMRAAVEALGKPRESFEVVLVQLVNLLKAGEQVAMSTRAGQFETLADVIMEVGADAARFMFLSRKSDSPLDFDLDLVKRRTLDNPVYYVQYAHARVSSVLRRAAERGLSLPERATAELLALLKEEEELELLRILDRFTDTVSGAARNLAPHHVSYYLMELSGALHSYYAAHQVLGAGSGQLSLARLALLRAVGQTVRNGLELLGVEAPESM